MATRRAEDVVARRQAGMAITEDPTREGAGSLVGGGGGSMAGKAGLVSYSLEDYDGLTKDDSYVVIEMQTCGSMFPLGLDSQQGRLDVNALATKLALLEVADRDREMSTPVGRSLTPLSSDFKEVGLEGGACHRVTITVETIGTVVGWEFSTEPKGLAFGITFCKDDRQEEVRRDGRSEKSEVVQLGGKCVSTNVNPLPKNVMEGKGLEGNKMILCM